MSTMCGTKAVRDSRSPSEGGHLIRDHTMELLGCFQSGQYAHAMLMMIGLSLVGIHLPSIWRRDKACEPAFTRCEGRVDSLRDVDAPDVHN